MPTTSIVSRRNAVIAAGVAAAAALAAGAALTLGGPGSAGAADHLDSPGTLLDGQGPPGGDVKRDINDIYAFNKGGKTVLIMTVNPASAPGKQQTFSTAIPGVKATKRTTYNFRIDNDGDAREEVTLEVSFGAPDDRGVQSMTIKRNGKVLVSGRSSAFNQYVINRSSDGKVRSFAGVSDDPFFFDLVGFKKITAAIDTDPNNNADSFVGCTSARPDFFKGLNVSTIAIELPSTLLTAGDTNIGVWATTNTGGKQIDRMGRPAINTVFNPANPFEPTEASLKNTFNKAIPANDQRDFRGEVVDTLQILFTLNDTAAGENKADDAGKIDGLADILLPDILTFDTADESGFLNGRQLADDVIDAELGLITEGAVTTDCVSKNDKKFWPSFPYVARPHKAS